MYDALLQSIATIIDLNGNEHALIRNLFRHTHLEQGEHFLLAGDVCRKVGYITKGIFRYYINRDGDDLTYYFATEREFVCDYPSFLVAQPSDKNIEALEPTDLLTISFDNLQILYRDVEQGERFGRLIAEQIFTQVLDQLTSLYQDQPEQRYIRFLQQFPHLVERLPQYYIASYIGIRPQSLSRIRRRTSLS